MKYSFFCWQRQQRQSYSWLDEQSYIPDLLMSQRQSFEIFLRKGLIETLDIQCLPAYDQRFEKTPDHFFSAISTELNPLYIQNYLRTKKETFLRIKTSRTYTLQRQKYDSFGQRTWENDKYEIEVPRNTIQPSQFSREPIVSIDRRSVLNFYCGSTLVESELSEYIDSASKYSASGFVSRVLRSQVLLRNQRDFPFVRRLSRSRISNSTQVQILAGNSFLLQEHPLMKSPQDCNYPQPSNRLNYALGIRLINNLNRNSAIWIYRLFRLCLKVHYSNPYDHVIPALSCHRFNWLRKKSCINPNLVGLRLSKSRIQAGQRRFILLSLVSNFKLSRNRFVKKSNTDHCTDRFSLATRLRYRLGAIDNKSTYKAINCINHGSLSSFNQYSYSELLKAKKIGVRTQQIIPVCSSVFPLALTKKVLLKNSKTFLSWIHRSNATFFSTVGICLIPNIFLPTKLLRRRIFNLSGPCSYSSSRLSHRSMIWANTLTLDQRLIVLDSIRSQDLKIRPLLKIYKPKQFRKSIHYTLNQFFSLQNWVYSGKTLYSFLTDYEQKFRFESKRFIPYSYTNFCHKLSVKNQLSWYYKLQTAWDTRTLNRKVFDYCYKRTLYKQDTVEKLRDCSSRFAKNQYDKIQTCVSSLPPSQLNPKSIRWNNTFVVDPQRLNPLGWDHRRYESKSLQIGNMGSSRSYFLKLVLQSTNPDRVVLQRSLNKVKTYYTKHYQSQPYKSGLTEVQSWSQKVSFLEIKCFSCFVTLPFQSIKKIHLSKFPFNSVNKNVPLIKSLSFIKKAFHKALFQGICVSFNFLTIDNLLVHHLLAKFYDLQSEAGPFLHQSDQGTYKAKISIPIKWMLQSTKRLNHSIAWARHKDQTALQFGSVGLKSRKNLGVRNSDAQLHTSFSSLSISNTYSSTVPVANSTEQLKVSQKLIPGLAKDHSYSIQGNSNLDQIGDYFKPVGLEDNLARLSSNQLINNRLGHTKRYLKISRDYPEAKLRLYRNRVTRFKRSKDGMELIRNLKSIHKSYPFQLVPSVSTGSTRLHIKGFSPFNQINTKSCDWRQDDKITFHDDYSVYQDKKIIHKHAVLPFIANKFIKKWKLAYHFNQLFYSSGLSFSLPMMTDRGVFIVNGVSRCLLHQRSRLPGVYMCSDVQNTGKKNQIRSFRIQFISHRGPSIKIFTEEKNQLRIWVQIGDHGLIPLFLFLRALGFTRSHLLAWLSLSFLNYLERQCFEDIKRLRMPFLKTIEPQFSSGSECRPLFPAKSIFNVNKARVLLKSRFRQQLRPDLALFSKKNYSQVSLKLVRVASRTLIYRAWIHRMALGEGLSIGVKEENRKCIGLKLHRSKVCWLNVVATHDNSIKNVSVSMEKANFIVQSDGLRLAQLHSLMFQRSIIMGIKISRFSTYTRSSSKRLNYGMKYYNFRAVIRRLWNLNSALPQVDGLTVLKGSEISKPLTQFYNQRSRTYKVISKHKYNVFRPKTFKLSIISPKTPFGQSFFNHRLPINKRLRFYKIETNLMFERINSHITTMQKIKKLHFCLLSPKSLTQSSRWSLRYVLRLKDCLSNLNLSLRQHVVSFCWGTIGLYSISYLLQKSASLYTIDDNTVLLGQTQLSDLSFFDWKIRPWLRHRAAIFWVVLRSRRMKIKTNKAHILPYGFLISRSSKSIGSVPRLRRSQGFRYNRIQTQDSVLVQLSRFYRRVKLCGQGSLKAYDITGTGIYDLLGEKLRTSSLNNLGSRKTALKLWSKFIIWGPLRSPKFLTQLNCTIRLSLMRYKTWRKLTKLRASLPALGGYHESLVSQQRKNLFQLYKKKRLTRLSIQTFQSKSSESLVFSGKEYSMDNYRPFIKNCFNFQIQPTVEYKNYFYGQFALIYAHLYSYVYINKDALSWDILLSIEAEIIWDRPRLKRRILCAHRFFSQILFSPSMTNLGYKGRTMVNQRFSIYKTFWDNLTSSTKFSSFYDQSLCAPFDDSPTSYLPLDFLHASKSCMDLMAGIIQPDDIDHLQSRYIRRINETFKDILFQGYEDFLKERHRLEQNLQEEIFSLHLFPLFEVEKTGTHQFLWESLGLCFSSVLQSYDLLFIYNSLPFSLIKPPGLKTLRRFDSITPLSYTSLSRLRITGSNSATTQKFSLSSKPVYSFDIGLRRSRVAQRRKSCLTHDPFAKPWVRHPTKPPFYGFKWTILRLSRNRASSYKQLMLKTQSQLGRRCKVLSYGHFIRSLQLRQDCAIRQKTYLKSRIKTEARLNDHNIDIRYRKTKDSNKKLDNCRVHKRKEAQNTELTRVYLPRYKSQVYKKVYKGKVIYPFSKLCQLAINQSDYYERFKSYEGKSPLSLRNKRFIKFKNTESLGSSRSCLRSHLCDFKNPPGELKRIFGFKKLFLKNRLSNFWLLRHNLWLQKKSILEMLIILLKFLAHPNEKKFRFYYSQKRLVFSLKDNPNYNFKLRSAIWTYKPISTRIGKEPLHSYYCVSRTRSWNHTRSDLKVLDIPIVCRRRSYPSSLGISTLAFSFLKRFSLPFASYPSSYQLIRSRNCSMLQSYSAIKLSFSEITTRLLRYQNRVFAKLKIYDNPISNLYQVNKVLTDSKVHVGPKKIKRQKTFRFVVLRLIEKLTLGSLNSSFRVLSDFDILDKTFRYMFNAGNSLFQLTDDTNSVAEITHKRRLSSLGPGGLNAENAGFQIRDIHPSQYGRICPIETAEGKNAGLVTSLSLYSKIGSSGQISSLLLPLDKKGVHLYRSFEPKIVGIEPQVEHFWRLGMSERPFSVHGTFFNDPSLELNYKRGSRHKLKFAPMEDKYLSFLSFSPLDMISVAPSLIPFLEHDDANRALMGANMQRQASPLLRCEKPLISTGMDQRVGRESTTAILSAKSGRLLYSDAHLQVLQSKVLGCKSIYRKFEGSKSTFCQRRQELNLLRSSKTKLRHQFSYYRLVIGTKNKSGLIIQQSSVEKTFSRILSLKHVFRRHYGFSRIGVRSTFVYHMENHPRSNQKFYVNYTSTRKSGTWSRKGDLLGKRAGIERGESAIGNHALVAYTTWDGYNFEDAIAISERLVYDDLYTSLHIHRFESHLSPTSYTTPIYKGEVHNDEDVLRGLYLDSSGIIRVGSWVQNGALCIGQMTWKKKVQDGQTRLLYMIFRLKARHYIDTSRYLPSRLEGRILRVEIRGYNLTSELMLGHGAMVKGSTKPKSYHLGSSNFIGKRSSKSSWRRSIPLQVGCTLSQPQVSGLHRFSTRFSMIPSQSLDQTSYGSKPGLLGIVRRKQETSNFSGQTKYTKGLNCLKTNLKSDYEIGHLSERKQQPYISWFKFQNHLLGYLSFQFINIYPSRNQNYIAQYFYANRRSLCKVGQMQRNLVSALKKYSLINFLRSKQSYKAKYSFHQTDTFPLQHHLFDLSSWSNSSIREDYSISSRMVSSYNIPLCGYKEPQELDLNLMQSLGEVKVSRDTSFEMTLPYLSSLVRLSYIPRDLSRPLRNLSRRRKFLSLKAGGQSFNLFRAQSRLRRSQDSKVKQGKFFSRFGSVRVKSRFRISPYNKTFQRVSSLGLCSHYPIQDPLSSHKSTYTTDSRLSPILRKARRNQTSSLRITSVRFFLGQSRRLRIGDKMAGRHGNKGIVSLIIPIRDLPFMRDGSIFDILLSPLGVPSRMNIGQIFECVHSLAAYQLQTAFRIHPFDEVFGYEASRYLVYYYLHRAAEQTQHKALFESRFPGKSILFDGRSGRPFEQPICSGYPYMLKLVHMVDDKIHGRYTGTYAQITNQPLQGRKNGGGQRLGEMEIWAVEAYGPSFLLQEFLTTKSDDEKSRSFLATSTKENKQGSLCTHIPSSFRLLLSEFKGLGLSTNLTDI